MPSKIWFGPKDPNVKRILFHARSRVGLGHINRTVAVAQLLLAKMPNLQFLFLIENGLELIEDAGLPGVLIYAHNTHKEHNDQSAVEALKVFRPDLVIYETFLDEVIARPVNEIGMKQAVMASAGLALESQFRDRFSVIEKVNLFLICQHREEILPHHQAMLARYPGKIVYVGPLVRRKSQIAPDDLRKQLGITKADKVILVTLGGGGYLTATDLFNSILAARAKILDSYPQARLIMITGPHFAAVLPKEDAFVCFASKFVPNLTDYMNIASAIVCMAGYNTVREVIVSGVPAVCVPTAEADDQIGVGSMSEYALRFPNVVVSSTHTEELTHKVIEALGKDRDISVVEDFWRQAETASQRTVNEIIELLNA